MVGASHLASGGVAGRKISYNVPLGITQEVVAIPCVGRSLRPTGVYDRNTFIHREGGKLSKGFVASQATILGVKEELQFLKERITLLMKLIDEDMSLGQDLGMGCEGFKPMGRFVG